jgi:hypothetical protein
MSAVIEHAQMRGRVERARPTDYVTELLLCPGRIETAEKEVAATASYLARAEEALEDECARLLVEEVIEGKNKEARDAHLRLHTRHLRAEVERLTRLLEDRKITLRKEQNRFSAFKAVTRYLGREED